MTHLETGEITIKWMCGHRGPTEILVDLRQETNYFLVPICLSLMGVHDGALVPQELVSNWILCLINLAKIRVFSFFSV